jgi:hypothetical protein
VRQFVGRVMGIKDKVKALAPGLDPYFKTVFVFTSARVDANWGTTGNLHCIRDDQLFKYIVEDKMGKGLTKDEVNTIAQAFLGLAPDALPAVRRHQGIGGNQRHDFNKLTVLVGQIPHFLDQHRAALALNVLPNVLQCKRHGDPILPDENRSKREFPPCFRVLQDPL